MQSNDPHDPVEALEYYNSGLIARAEMRKKGDNIHDVVCWIMMYINYCGADKYKGLISVPHAKWYRDVLMIFANGQANNIRDAQELHMNNLGLKTRMQDYYKYYDIDYRKK